MEGCCDWEIKVSAAVNFVKFYAVGLMAIYLKIVSHIPSHFIRRLCYQVVGMKIARGATIYSGVEVRSPWKITLGKRSIVGEGALLDGRRGIVIGADVNISSGAWIWTLHHDFNSSSFEAVGGPVYVGDRAWLCSRSTILPGVSIGDAAVVAAGAVVVGDVEAFSLVGGVPAKKIGERSKDLRYRLGEWVPFI